MQIDIRLPQIDEVLNEIRALNNKIDALAAIASDRPMQVDPPMAEKPVQRAWRAGPDGKPVTVDSDAPKPKGRRRAELVSSTTEATSVSRGNGAPDEDRDDEDALRARAAFEAKRIARVLGIGATRAVIRMISGPDVLNIDDVPAAQLPKLLAKLQAM